MTTILKHLKWLNYYNLIVYNMIAGLIIGLPYMVLDALVKLDLFPNLAKKGLQVTTPLLCFTTILCIGAMLIPLLVSKGELDLLKSLQVTRKARRFLEFTKGRTAEGSSYTSATKADKSLANASLRTLTITYYFTGAVVSLKLPANIKAQEMVIERLPELKKMLNNLHNGYAFNDLTPENDRLYSAIGRRIIS